MKTLSALFFALLLFCQVTDAAQNATVSEHLNTIRLTKVFGKKFINVVGVTAGGRVVCWSSPVGQWAYGVKVQVLDVVSGHVVHNLNIPDDMVNERGVSQLLLSPDGRLLFTSANFAKRTLDSQTNSTITVMDAETLRIVKIIHLGRQVDVQGIGFLKTTGHLLLLDLATRKYDGPNGYNDDFRTVVYDWLDGSARRIKPEFDSFRALTTPSQESVALLMHYKEGWNVNVAMHSLRSGKVTLTEGEDFKAHYHLLDGPFFFTSPNGIICSPFIWIDLHSQKWSYLSDLPSFEALRPSGKKKALPSPAVGGVSVSQNVVHDLTGRPETYADLGGFRQRYNEGHSYAFFATVRGLELWNVNRRLLVRRWPTLHNISYVEAEPRLGFMVVHRKGEIQVWRFDKKWIQA